MADLNQEETEGEALEKLEETSSQLLLSGLTEPLEGECGEGITFRLDPSGELTIRGTGDMADYNNPSSVPGALSEGSNNCGRLVYDNPLPLEVWSKDFQIE